MPYPHPGECDASDYLGTVSKAALQDSTALDPRYQASFQALLVTDPADDMQMIANKKDKPVGSTGIWMLLDQAYLQWLNEDRSRVLWLHGDPGKGKTMLAIALVEELTRSHKRLESPTRSALLYFFFATTRTTGEVMLR